VRIIFFLLYFLLFSPIVQGQNYFTRNITMEDGLPSNTIRDIYKDSRGFIWIGTEAGLVKYDGSEFTTYTTRDGLSGNRIWSITEDTLGNLWLANYGNGISRFDGKKFTNFTTNNGLINNNVRIVQYSDKHKGLLIGTIFGFSFYKDSAFISFTDSTQTERNLLQVTSFLETDDSTICLLTYRDNKQYIAFNPYKKSFKYLDKKHRFHALYPITTFSYITQQKDTLMGNLYYGMKIYKKDTMLINDKVGQIFDAVEDKKGNVWLASWNNYDIKPKDDKGGVYKYSNNKEEYFNDKLGIETEQCWCLHYDDTENLLWIGTLDKGIYLFPMDGISYINADELNPDEPVIKDIFIDSKKNFWITAGDKVIKNFNPKSNLSARQFNSAYIKHFLTTKKINSVEKFKGKLHQLNEGPEGNIWVGSDVGIFQVTPDLKHIDYLADFKHFITNSGFFFPSSKTVAFIIFYFIRNQNIETGNIQKDLNFRENTTYSSTGKHQMIGNNIWIINDSDGISLYKNDHLQFFPYLKNQIDLNFSAICSDVKNRIIVGTLTGNIHFLKYTNDSLIVEHTIDLEPEFHGSKVNWLITNKNNQLLAGTNKGLVLIDLNKQNYIVKFFDKNSGYFAYDSFKAVQDSSGNIYVISNDYITKLDNAFPLQNETKHKLLINDIEINNKSYDWSEIAKTDNWNHLPGSKVKLKHHQNSLIFYCNLLQFKNNNNTLYSYKLEGSSMDWTPYTREKKAVFTYLTHGHYTFKVKGYNLSNPENIVETTFDFQISPPWYKTWFFYVLTGFFVFLIIYLSYRTRISRVREKAHIQQKISELKLDALKAQMNPHFIFNAFNSLQKYILLQETTEALNYMSEFASLIRKTLDNSTEKEIRLSEEIEYLKTYLELEKIRVSNLDYSITVDKMLDTEYLLIPPMLIQPFVENAILHGIRHLKKQGMMKISFERDHSFLKVTIEDNGIGRKQSLEINQKNRLSHHSKGTSITEQRIKLLSEKKSSKIKVQTIDLETDGKVSGTKVILYIPMQ